MKNCKFYYSTNTLLSNHISKVFYDSKFYVWCSPVFDPSKLGEYDVGRKIPVSSSPFKIYKELRESIDSGDLHSDKLSNNRAGLLRGATIALSNQIISEEDFGRIKYMVENAQLVSFRPLLYIINVDKVSEKIISVRPEEKAGILSEEYIIENLENSDFDIIEF